MQLGLALNILNFENGCGTLGLSVYWQLVTRGAFLLIVILDQTRVTCAPKAAG